MNLISNQVKDIFAEMDQESVSATHNRAGSQLHAFYVYNNHLRAEGGTNSTMPIKLLNITTEEFETMTLFKYMSLPYAVDSIMKDTIWFSNPEKWKDPFESYFINNAYDKADSPYDFPLKEHLFVCCFSTISRSEAQWRMYSENNTSIMFDISKNGLVHSLNQLSSEYDIYIGKAVYLPTTVLMSNDVSTIISSMNYPSPNNDIEKALLLMLCKRKAFQYESEVRVFLIPKDERSKKCNGVKVNVLLKNITKRYTISPLLRKEEQLAIKEVLLSMNGVKNVSCATLYDPVINKVLNW